MIDVKILKNDILTNRGTFKTLEEANAWLMDCEGKLKFGPLGSYIKEIVEHDDNLLKEKEEAKKYLADTDWYIIRELDNGTPCPQEIKDLRAAARLKL